MLGKLKIDGKIGVYLAMIFSRKPLMLPQLKLYGSKPMEFLPAKLRRFYTSMLHTSLRALV